ncbi:hypothetical protein [Nocardia salmonicida]|uniref:hypothetical protein n=1 Tax=Nocardia salmonicida TaxID=53431 RepID=UPI000A3DEC15|nr:hypothetical protein [Nocardia salmonicida]
MYDRDIEPDAWDAGLPFDGFATGDPEPPATGPDSAGPAGETVEGEFAEGRFAAYTVDEAALRGGAITVRTTDSGLPLAVRVNADQLRRSPADLAADLLVLCRQAADRAGLRRRAYLADLGVPPDALDLLGLPVLAQVEQAELGFEADHDYEPRSWLDRA